MRNNPIDGRGGREALPLGYHHNHTTVIGTQPPPPPPPPPIASPPADDDGYVYTYSDGGNGNLNSNTYGYDYEYTDKARTGGGDGEGRKGKRPDGVAVASSSFASSSSLGCEQPPFGSSHGDEANTDAICPRQAGHAAHCHHDEENADTYAIRPRKAEGHHFQHHQGQDKRQHAFLSNNQRPDRFLRNNDPSALSSSLTLPPRPSQPSLDSRFPMEASRSQFQHQQQHQHHTDPYALTLSSRHSVIVGVSSPGIIQREEEEQNNRSNTNSGSGNANLTMANVNMTIIGDNTGAHAANITSNANATNATEPSHHRHIFHPPPLSEGDGAVDHAGLIVVDACPTTATERSSFSHHSHHSSAHRPFHNPKVFIASVRAAVLCASAVMLAVGVAEKQIVLKDEYLAGGGEESSNGSRRDIYYSFWKVAQDPTYSLTNPASSLSADSPWRNAVVKPISESNVCGRLKNAFKAAGPITIVSAIFCLLLFIWCVIRSIAYEVRRFGRRRLDFEQHLHVEMPPVIERRRQMRRRLEREWYLHWAKAAYHHREVEELKKEKQTKAKGGGSPAPIATTATTANTPAPPFSSPVASAEVEGALQNTNEKQNDDDAQRKLLNERSKFVSAILNGTLPYPPLPPFLQRAAFEGGLLSAEELQKMRSMTMLNQQGRCDGADGPTMMEMKQISSSRGRDQVASLAAGADDDAGVRAADGADGRQSTLSPLIVHWGLTITALIFSLVPWAIVSEFYNNSWCDSRSPQQEGFAYGAGFVLIVAAFAAQILSVVLFFLEGSADLGNRLKFLYIIQKEGRRDEDGADCENAILFGSDGVGSSAVGDCSRESVSQQWRHDEHNEERKSAQQRQPIVLPPRGSDGEARLMKMLQAMMDGGTNKTVAANVGDGEWAGALAPAPLSNRATAADESYDYNFNYD